MRQAIMVHPGQLEFQDVPEPEVLEPDEVLLRIRRIGICGSDIHVYHGEHPATPYPVIQGHEYSAIVEAIGSKVTGFTPGMRVTARPQLVCGKCGPCLRGQYNICQNLKVQGFQAPGTAQDLFVIKENQVVQFPDTMSFEEGALVEPSAVGAHATSRVSSLQDKNVVVCGAGTIGNLVAQFAIARGAKKVIITDISDFRLAMARACGIHETVNVATHDFQEEMKRILGDEGFQVGFEAAGVQSSLDLLLKYMEKGGELVVLGVYAKNPMVNMFYLGEHELKMIGSLMYLHEDYKEAVKAISSQKIKVKPLITHRYRFEQFDEAYKFINSNREGFLKVMIEM